MTTPWDTSTLIGAVRLVAGQVDADVTYATALSQVDAIMYAEVNLGHTGGPPGSPLDGDRYIVQTATGDWSGHLDDFALFYNSAWYFVEPWEGLTVYDSAGASKGRWIWSGSAWVQGVTPQADVTDLSQTTTNPPTQAEVQAIANKVDELLAALRSAEVLG